MFCNGLRVKVVDKRREDEKYSRNGVIIVAPHSSHYDLASMLAISPKTPVAKVEDLWNPFFGAQLILSNAVLVLRGDGEARQRTFQELKERSTREEIGLFPEATVTNGKSLILFKVGGFVPATPVTPVTVEYQTPGTVNNVSWTWKSPSLFGLWLLSCAKFSFTTSIITLLPKYYPNQEERKCPILYANNVRKRMARELNLPCSRYSYEEAFHLEFATKNRLPLTPTSLKLVKVIQKLSKLPLIQASSETSSEPVDNKIGLMTEEKEPKAKNGFLTHRIINGKNNGFISNGNGSIHSNSNGSTSGRGNGHGNGHLPQVNGSKTQTNGGPVNGLIRKSVKINQLQLLREVVTKSIEKIQALDKKRIQEPISSPCHLIRCLQFPTGSDTMKIKTAFIDLYESLIRKEGDTVSCLEVLVLLLLMDTSESDVWSPIERVCTLLESHEIPPKEAFCTLIFYLLGVEESQVSNPDIDLGTDSKFDINFCRKHLISILRRPVYDNAPYLLGPNPAPY
jgi:1-acyl-sn-glycerol-3-phosphate acyltransferase